MIVYFWAEPLSVYSAGLLRLMFATSGLLLLADCVSADSLPSLVGGGEPLKM